MSVSEEKKIAPWLEASAEIRLEYFGDNPTTKSLAVIKDEVITKYLDLDLHSLASVLMILEIAYKEFQSRIKPMEIA